MSSTGRREAISVVPPAERQGYAAGVPSAAGTMAQVGASTLAERPSYVSAGPATGSGISGAHAQVPNSAGHLPSGGAVPNPMIAGNQDQTTTSSDEPETVKPGVSSLPKLKAIDSGSSPIDFQDWVTLLKAPMCDRSATSHLWWPKVVQEVEATYARFATSGPIERLGITPHITDELIEDDFRVKMVNRRMCDSAVGILYRLMTLYAPGGESEKTLTLKKLQNPTRCTDPQLAAEELRAWERWKKRAETLGLLTPDPTILVKGLASIISGVLEKAVNREIAFRASLVRSVLQVDSKPTMDTVMQFHGHLLGEMEQLASTAPRKGVANQNTNPNANNNQEVCRQINQMMQHQKRRPKRLGRPAFRAGSLAKRIQVAQRARLVCLRMIGAGFQISLPGASHVPVCVTLPRIAQTAKQIIPKVRVRPKARDGKGKDNSAGANTRGGNSVTNKTVMVEEVPQSQSASSSSGTPQPTIGSRRQHHLPQPQTFRP